MAIQAIWLQRLYRFLIFLLCLYGTLCVLLYLLQESLLFHEDTLPTDYAYSFKQPFEEVWLPVAEETRINALHFTTPDSKGVVLYFHGNGGSLRLWGDVAPVFTRYGYDLFVVDYRGYGKSTGKIRREQDLHDDAAAAYAYLRQFYAEDEIVVYGRSLGSGIAAKVAQQNRPRLLILETPYYSLLDVVKQFVPLLPNGLLKYQIKTYEWLPDVKCPVYLFHGTKDELIPYRSSLRLLPLIETEHELITIEGGQHNDLGAYALYHDGLADILRE